MDNQTKWYTERQTIPQTVPDFWFNWLSRPCKLSEAFRRVSQTLIVDVIDQRFEFVLPDEADYLDLPNNAQAFLRQVYVLGDGKRFEYARVIVPKATYDRHLKQFENLGQNLIGEKLLYSNSKTKRSQFEYTALFESDPRYHIALRLYQGEKPEMLWARRSLFWLEGEDLPLLVMEVFLPDVPSYVSN